MPSITEELRDWAQASFGGEHQVAARPYLQAINAIADRIDAEHSSKIEALEDKITELSFHEDMGR